MILASQVSPVLHLDLFVLWFQAVQLDHCFPLNLSLPVSQDNLVHPGTLHYLATEYCTKSYYI
jgi:hypothetical protein